MRASRRIRANNSTRNPITALHRWHRKTRWKQHQGGPRSNRHNRSASPRWARIKPSQWARLKLSQTSTRVLFLGAQKTPRSIRDSTYIARALSIKQKNPGIPGFFVVGDTGFEILSSRSVRVDAD